MTIVIPAYNESRNINIVIPRILRVLPQSTIVIVDDSIGEEQEQTEKYCQNYKARVVYIARKRKQGRGSAVIDGMKVALKGTSSKIIIEMDADLAHDPREIPRLCDDISRFDMVIGSRYMKGSTIFQWTWLRIIQSKIINMFLRYWLGLGVTDYTNGFRAYSRKACEYLVTIPLYEKGFIALSEIAYRLVRAGFRIIEIPVSFTDRTYGKSNATIWELFHSLFGVIALRLRKDSAYAPKRIRRG